ncbi:MAG: hypothetical protein IJO28_02720, partial [Oscillospiraceae bacterium]|nr:hypothetical protein [Oscillospiraceae bacterium]
RGRFSVLTVGQLKGRKKTYDPRKKKKLNIFASLLRIPNIYIRALVSSKKIIHFSSAIFDLLIWLLIVQAKRIEQKKVTQTPLKLRKTSTHNSLA